MNKITPHLWFDKEAKEAAEFYTSIFANSKIKSAATLHDTPSGDADMLTIQLEGQDFMLISAGPYFKFTPAVSFTVACATEDEVNALWSKLALGGETMMELGSYPFSKRYGWTKDKFGLSWQVMFVGDSPIKQKITPMMMFVGENCGKTEEAVNFYTSVFKNSGVDHMMRYGKGQEPDQEGTVQHAGFTLENQDFAAMDSAHDHKFNFNEAVSFVVRCETQEEIDYYWEKLSADPKSEQCGWLKDRFGLSWQVTPTVMEKMMREGKPEQMKRVTEAFLKMKKFDLAVIEKAYVGE